MLGGLMSCVVELFTRSTIAPNQHWATIIGEQLCPLLGDRCYKVRKINPEISIGVCTVLHGRTREPIMICPARLIERRQIFVDCLHLLTTHEPGNELHLVSEVSIPGGSVDYFLVSTRERRVKDFVGIELQTLDTTGAIWPERQKLLKELGVPRGDNAENAKKRYGINWKMTAKTILMQMHHKIQTFEHINKKLVLVMQDKLLAYMTREFNFAHLSNPPTVGDSMHFHAYRMTERLDRSYRLVLDARRGADAAGIAQCLGLQAEARIELEEIIRALQTKISQATLFAPI